MKKYIFLFLAILILLAAFRQVVGVSEPITAYQFFTIISDVNLTPDHIMNQFFWIRDHVYDVLDFIDKTSFPGSDDWSHGDRNILSFLRMISEILYDIGTGLLALVPICVKLVQIVFMSFVELLEMIYEILKLLLRLLGLWRT